tara:strand:+ start:411 stop:845 length:435 start_codon:yes stop_codon:yes gene_type:complete
LPGCAPVYCNQPGDRRHLSALQSLQSGIESSESDNVNPYSQIRRSLLLLSLLAMATTSQALPVVTDAAAELQIQDLQPPGVLATQGNGMSLAQAVESVRRRGDVERVISAETKTSGGRDVHYVRVMTKDGKVKTYKVNGQSRGR